MLVIIVPLRALELGAPASIIGLIAGAGAAVPAVLSIPFGGIADRTGARAVYAWSALASAVLCVGFAITESSARARVPHPPTRGEPQAPRMP